MMKPRAACLGSVPLFGCQRPRLTTLAINLTFSIRRLNAMQKVMLIGNLGRDPDVKYSQQGTAIAQFSVATTERWKDKGGELQEHTEWFAVNRNRGSAPIKVVVFCSCTRASPLRLDLACRPLNQ